MSRSRLSLPIAEPIADRGHAGDLVEGLEADNLVDGLVDGLEDDGLDEAECRSPTAKRRLPIEFLSFSPNPIEFLQKFFFISIGSIGTKRNYLR